MRLKPADEAGDETVVVATTGPVYALRWRSSRKLVVQVDRVDEVGDPVSEHLANYRFEGADGVPGEVRVILRRVEG